MVVLGIGWVGISFIKDLDFFMYDVKVVLFRNYFVFIFLFFSVICGIVEVRSIVEFIRNIVKKVSLKVFVLFNIIIIEVNLIKVI